MTYLQIDDRLVPTLEIEAADGEVHSYSFRPMAPEADAWAIEVERLDSGERYRVAVSRSGRWSCACLDWKYRRKPNGRSCKHTLAAQGLHAVYRALLREPIAEASAT